MILNATILHYKLYAVYLSRRVVRAAFEPEKPVAFVQNRNIDIRHKRDTIKNMKILQEMRTKNSSLSNIEALKVMDFATAEVFYGCDQRWFATEWQRSAGCGPSVASTILLYMNRRHASPASGPRDRDFIAARMEEVWQYVTPTDCGIPSTKMFCDAVRAYGAAKGLAFECHICDVPEHAPSRPDFAELSEFLDAALEKDIPVAFLNLCNGNEKNLDHWHWVTVISREGSLVHILDEGIVKIVDLAKWRDTTKQGGGFVWFEAG